MTNNIELTDSNLSGNTSNQETSQGTSQETYSWSGKLNWRSIQFFLTFHAIALLAPWYFSWSALGVTLFLHWLLDSIGICLGYHRLLTHRSFQVSKPLEYIIVILAVLSLQGGPIFWVSSHRRHHLHAEVVGQDPHAAQRGFWWSHMGWLICPEADTWLYDRYKRFAPDLERDRFYRWLERTDFLIRNDALLQIPLGLLLYWWGGWSFVIYGIFVRTVFQWHCTWFVNSACHLWGYRSFEQCEDNSRNLWWVSILTFGEGWHNNHHAYPNVAKAGFKWWELDMTWWVIRGLNIAGLAQRVVLPPTDTATD
jgi:sn-2 palmitoyl-lipid 9-desaturase